MEDHEHVAAAPLYPAAINIRPVMENRNRVTTAFRFFLAIPHLLLVGGPIALIGLADWNSEAFSFGSSSGGVLGIVAGVAALIAWFAILFTGRHPAGLWKLGAFYLRWRVRATAYMTLLLDEYPPFGDDEYPAQLDLVRPATSRDRVTVALRILLALPHILLLCLLGMVWALVTAVAWVMILVTGRYPETLYGFSLGVFAWTVRVEAYVLLLRDEYPPFTLRV